MNKHFYITTPIYYVNDKPHIGHAYTSIAADIIARFKRLDGFKVMFLTGTDEHGQKIAQVAEKQNIAPLELCDRISENFRLLMKDMNISNDDFIRTTEKRHALAATNLWQKLEETGNIYQGTYSGWYSSRDEAFISNDEVKDGLAPSGAPVEWMEETSYFFKLSDWQQELLSFYEQNPDFIAPQSRRNEVIKFVESGLKDLSISRTSISWGIPVPNDNKHVMYVWIDALTNYISALGYPNENTPDFQEYWSSSLHLIGKDIIRFHAVYWPAFLMAAGLTPPKKIFAHGWWTNEGQKISKSLGNVIDPYELKNNYGLDQTRYFLMRNMTFGDDGNFSHNNIRDRINHDLANDLGNMVQRVMTIVHKNFEEGISYEEKELNEQDIQLLKQGYDALDKLRLLFDRQSFEGVLNEIWQFISEINKFIDRQTPWALSKADPSRFKTVMAVLTEAIFITALYIMPFMPESADKIFNMLNLSDEDKTFSNIGIKKSFQGAFTKPNGLFPKILDA